MKIPKVQANEANEPLARGKKIVNTFSCAQSFHDSRSCVETVKGTRIAIHLVTGPQNETCILSKKNV